MYTTFTGRGVTVALLDSGYYPHPDLSVAATLLPIKIGRGAGRIPKGTMKDMVAHCQV